MNDEGIIESVGEMIDALSQYPREAKVWIYNIMHFHCIGVAPVLNGKTGKTDVSIGCDLIPQDAPEQLPSFNIPTDPSSSDGG